VPLPFKLIYGDGYDLNLGEHVFPAIKYRLIHERLLADGVAERADFLDPEPVSDLDLLRVHTAGWVERLKNGTLSEQELLTLQIPYSTPMVQALWLATGGSIQAAEVALRDGIGFNLGGGFHHAFANHGEGFCALNDVAVSIRHWQHESASERRIRRAMVVDLDVHQGNGTAAIFRDDPTVFTFSLHQQNNYPAEKPPSDLDVPLPDGMGDEEYLAVLAEKFTPALADFQPDLLFYVAGADPYAEDQLGGLGLTIEGLRKRDGYVFKTARRYGIPVAVVLAGGYARNVSDTVAIHAGTVVMAKEAMAVHIGHRVVEV
jgi:acetoin utilization deacetylase AcuC-like enzyme